MTHTLLLVDDERDSLEPMRLMLEDHYLVLTAMSGESALRVLEEKPVDVLIADQRMPGMTGVELLTRVKDWKPDIVRLVLTAFTDFDAMLKAINEGRVYRYIIKPWDVDDMRLTIRQALEWRDLLVAKGQLAADLHEAHRNLLQRTRELEAAQQTILRQEKLAAVGRFASEMVHEMTNYLQVVMMLNTQLAEMKQSELEQVKQIELQATTLAEVAASIRDFAQGVAMPFSRSQSDPIALVREVVHLCSHHPAFRHVRLEVVPAPELGLWRLDPRQLKHLLLNLFKNAARASSKGQAIEIGLAYEAGALVVRVIDHGAGVPPEHRARLFEPFFTTDERDGTGLGLPLCKQIAEAHGGRIDFEETPGGGATFVVRLP
ncbi:MAG TPA: hybrid sensor histidine kinase/response regulator [Myxococcota bacterium]|nr:hybrid sensor histidine kinase/response regulator [Myxococcota bacterium]HRY94634.1 hybrid sensor histidine kinase/response regulator [Myxococcota bacterium]HSA21662.1 hybrid sensor histidine kinase/response regulator [Myxococcota bacterium]